MTQKTPPIFDSASITDSFIAKSGTCFKWQFKEIFISQKIFFRDAYLFGTDIA